MEPTIKDIIIDAYKKIVEEKRRIPTYTDLIPYEINRDAVRRSFGNLTELHSYIEENHHEIISDNLAHESVLFSPKKLASLKNELVNYKRFFVTSAVTGKKVNANALEAVRHYCKMNEALLLILPCADSSSTRQGIHWTFDTLLKNEHFIHEETKLNSKIFLSNIKLSAKQIQPTTGLSRIGQRNGSYIFASPKQSLEYVATSAQKDRHPMALMTPGSITIADYKTDKYMSERTSYIAENDHVMGGIVLEIENNKRFYFRQVQFNQAGEFIDLGKRYFPDGSIEEEEVNIVLGDWHCGWTDPKVKKTTMQIINELKVRDVVVHDFFDGYSVNHHIKDYPLKKAINFQNNRSILRKEIEECGVNVNEFHKNISGDIIYVRGNHDDRLEGWLLKGEYVKDPSNHYIALDLAKTVLDGDDVLAYAMKNYGNILEFDRIKWISRDAEYKIGGVEVGQHGDLGSNGSKGSLATAEKSYGNCIIGHSHSAAIMRNVWRVGTSTLLKVDYNKGPSSWTHAHCLIYNDGSRQMINIIEGKWRI